MKNTEITEAQIAEWKQKHGTVLSYTVDGLTGYFRKPTRVEVSYAQAAGDQGKNLIKQNETLINACWLGGDRAIIEEDSYFYGVQSIVEELLEVKVGEIKKL